MKYTDISSCTIFYGRTKIVHEKVLLFILRYVILKTEEECFHVKKFTRTRTNRKNQSGERKRRMDRLRTEAEQEQAEAESKKTVFIIAVKQAMESGNLPEFLWNCFSQKADKHHSHGDGRID